MKRIRAHVKLSGDVTLCDAYNVVSAATGEHERHDMFATKRTPASQLDLAPRHKFCLWRDLGGN